MSEAEDRKCDTRQLEKMRADWRQNPGEVQLRHLDGPLESYVLSAWHVRVGGTVHAPQVIATIETEAFTLDIEAFESGVLNEQCFAVGDAIPDRSVIARITPHNNEARNA